MDNQVSITPKEVPFLNGAYYVVWKVRMEAYLMVVDVDEW